MFSGFQTPSQFGMVQPESNYPSTSSEWNAAFLSYENVVSSNNDEVKLQATIKLRRLLGRAPKHLKLLTVPILTKMLEDSSRASVRLQDTAACCLKHIICDDEDHELVTLVCEPRTVASLVRILLQSAGICQKYLIKCIWGMATYVSESRTNIFACGGLEAVIELLSSSTDSEKIPLLEILSALALLRDVRRALVSFGKLNLLIDAAKYGSMVSKERASQAIGLLVIGRRVRRILVALGVIPALVDLFREGDFSTKRVAGNALGIISSHVDYIRPVAQAGVIPLYAELLCGPEQLGREIAEDVFCVLAVVQANAVEIVEHLVRILQEDNAAVRAAAADVLWDLSSYEHLVSVIYDSGAILLLVQLLGDENIDVREKVSGAIAQLSYREAHRFVLADAGGIPLLIEMLQDQSEELRDNAAESLINLAEDPNHHERLSQAFDMPALQNMRERMVQINAADQHMTRSLRHMSIQQLTRDPLLE